MSDPQFPEIAGLVLSGGEGRRLGGVDKGLVDWLGRPMASWVYQAMAGLVAPVMISANRSPEDYRKIGSWLLADDDRYRHQGPLAGLLAGLRSAQEHGRRALLICPCDTPEVDPAMLARLCYTWEADPSRPVVASCQGQLHPLHGVYPVSVVEALVTWLNNGERRVQGFARHVRALDLDCNEWRGSFTNRNRPEDFGS